MGRVILGVCLLMIWTLDVRAELPIKGYSTRLTLDSVAAGPDQTLTGSGAPGGEGIYVELWRMAPGTAAAESVASVQASAGEFSFEGVDVLEGEQYYVTLSRSWQFDVDGNAEGWGQMVNHATLSVSGGSLNVRINGVDPHFYNWFDYNSDYYRVVEIRLRNPNVAAHPGPFQDLGIYWGNFGTQVDLHFSEIPTEASAFETVFIPMNVGEVVINPGPMKFEMDGLWATGLHNSLRIDPLDTVVASAIGSVLQIDYIRIREDFRVDFNIADDLAGFDAGNVSTLSVADGFLSYGVTSSLDPYFFMSLLTGKLESQYFTSFVIGMDNSVAETSTSLRVWFNDSDSGTGFVDDGGTVQVAEISASVSGRQDLAVTMDLHTAPQGEWTEDGRVPVKGLRFDLPGTANADDEIRVDYIGFVPENPYGPSDPVFVPYPNNPPVAMIISDPPASSPVELVLRHGEATVVLDGTQSHDGDDGTQELTFWWDGEGGVVDQPDQPVVEVTFTEAGEYVYRLSVSDGELDDSATQVIIVKTRKVAALEQVIEKVERYIEKLEEKLKEKLEEAANAGSKKQAKKLEKEAKKLEKKIECATRCLERLKEKLEKEKAKSEKKEESKKKSKA